jgi:hypothetical protein
MKMTPQQIIRFARRNLLHAIALTFKDPKYDWHHFRIERIRGNIISLTGMADSDGIHHDGTFFTVRADEISQISLR